LPNFIGSGHQQDLQRLADQLSGLPLEQSRARLLGRNDESGVVNDHDACAQLRLGGRPVIWQGRSWRDALEWWCGNGRRGEAGVLVKTGHVHKAAIQFLAPVNTWDNSRGSGHQSTSSQPANLN
jgi:hypothetical protein